MLKNWYDPAIEQCASLERELTIYVERGILPSKISANLINAARQLKNQRDFFAAKLFYSAAVASYFDNKPNAAVDYRNFPNLT